MLTLKERFRKSSLYLMAGAFALSTVVLVGWAFDISWIKFFFPHTPTMNPMSGVCFILVAISFYWIHFKQQTGWLTTAVALVAVAVGFLRMLDFIAGTDVGVDRALFSNQLELVSFGASGNRMAPNTAFSFILLGISVILSASDKNNIRRIANYGTTVVLLIALFSIIGYLYQVKEYKGVLSYIPMALQTAIAFKLAGLAILFMNNDRGFMDVVTSPHGGGTIARLLIPTAILAPIVIGYLKLLRQWDSPIPEELGIAFLITGIVLLFLALILLVSFVIDSKDVQRKEAEDNLAKANTDLEQKVEERSKELYVNEKRYRSLFENSAEGISLLDKNLASFYQSPAVTAITGYSFEERKNLGNGIEMIHPDDRESAKASFQKLMQNPSTPLGFQYRVLHKNGKYIWIEGMATNLLADPDISAVVTNYRDITLRKEAENQLAASAEGLRALLENSADALVITDASLAAKYQSPATERMTGISMEFRRAHPNVRFTHPDDVPALEKSVAMIIKNPETPIPFQLRVLHRDGHYIWIEGVMTNLLHDKNVNGLTFSYRDITDRKKFDEQQKFLTSLVDSSSDAIIGKSLDGIITTWNRRAQTIFGYTQEEVIGKSYSLISPAENQIIDDKNISRILAGKSVEGRETKLLTKSGRLIDTIVTVSPIQDEQGKIIGASSTVRDVSEIKEAETKLAANEQRFKALIENIADAIVVNDEESNILYQSPSVTRILGYTADERLSKKVLDYIHPDYRTMFSELYSKLKSSPGQPLPFQYQFLHKSGEYIWLEGVVTNLLHDPSVNAYVANYRDVTERKQTEEKILNINIELEQRVADRTQQLQLVNKELEAFTYSVSHDLRAPLRIMNGFGQILMEDYSANFDPEGQKILDRIMKNSKKMGQLIDDLLDFSRLARSEMAMSEINMTALVQEVFEELAAGNAKIPQHHVDNLKSAIGDYRLIKQVWTNLLSNAIKYSSKKPDPVIHVGMILEKEKTIYYVKDNGDGFDMLYYPKLFGVFQRLHKESEFTGTGVGLALVQRIIIRHGGTVWAEGKPGEGATFYFQLPS